MADDRNAQLSVLVLDDDEVMREVLAALLQAEGHHVHSVSRAERAMEALHKGPAGTDVVLTDLRLPDTDTVALLHSLRAAVAPEMRLIGMSGSAATPAELELLDGFLLKPFSVKDFVEVVERARAGAALAPAPVSPPVSHAPVLDTEVYQRMTKSLPPSALRELYALTLDDVLKRTGAMRQAVAAGDSGLCKSEAHAMKGGCGMVGAMELRAIAAEIEAGSPVDTPTLYEIAAATERLRRMLEALI